MIPDSKYFVAVRTWRAPFRWLHPFRVRDQYEISVFRYEDGASGMTQSAPSASDAVHMALDYIECQWDEEVSEWQVTWDWSGRW